jgi:hypothetical protein
MPHTGVPWKAQQIGPDYIMQGANHERVFSIRDGMIPMIPDRKLIEAAPELLEALKLVVNSDGHWHLCTGHGKLTTLSACANDSICDAIRAAIAKVEHD